MKSGSNPSITPSLKKGGAQIQGKSKVGVPLPPPLPFILREKSSGMGQMLELGGGGGNYFFKQPSPQIVFVCPVSPV